jgi:hypothetical protein
MFGDTCKGENNLKKIETILGAGILKDAIAYADEEDTLLLNNVKKGVVVY